MKKAISGILLFLPILVCAQWAKTILPRPQKVEKHSGKFKPSDNMYLFIDARFAELPLKKMFFGEKFTYQPPDVSGGTPGIWVVYDSSVKNPEGYKIEIAKNRITVQASKPTGAYYGLITLMHISPLEQEKSYPDFEVILKKSRRMTITDEPAFGWRGLHLDVSRHFFTVNEIKEYLNLMALYKLNVFHWHLTDDQGWRIQIDKYPELTNVGAWRNGSMVGPYKNHQVDSIRYGGFYTKDQIRDVVEYARQRCITVVPEIEMPGHSLAAVASYPWLSCTGKSQEVAKVWGGFPDVYCPGKDSVFDFMQIVLLEVMELFPSEFIHIGGDECEKTRWKTCSLCQKRIADEGLKDELELQSYFVRRIEKFLNANGRKLIGWDEILEGGLAPNAAVMSWRGTAGGEEAARQGHKVVMSPGKPCYFDHYQSKDSTEPNAIGGYNPLRSVFEYQPIPSSLPGDQRKLVIGAQGNVWSEYLYTWSKVEYMVWPRAIALSDALWYGGDRKDYKDFLKILDTNSIFLENLDVNFCRHYKKEFKK